MSFVLEISDKKYDIEIIPIKIAETNAFYAKYGISNSKSQMIFSDSNGFPYYFSSVDFLKEMLQSKLH